MNGVHAKNNIYKNGEYVKHFDDRYEMSQNKKEPSKSQIKYRDELYQFCIEKGIPMNRFRLGRKNREISSNIQALITILTKHRLDREFFERNKPAE